MNQKFPDYDTIMTICRGRMINQFKEKKNTWQSLSDFNIEDILKKRLEFLNCHTNLRHDEKGENIAQLINIINFCCFYIDNLWEGRN